MKNKEDAIDVANELLKNINNALDTSVKLVVKHLEAENCREAYFVGFKEKFTNKTATNEDVLLFLKEMQGRM